jgi:quercetin dioxygenase-like cupin family protein
MLGSANHFLAGGTVVEHLEHPVWVPVQYVVERNLKPDSYHHWPLEPTFPLDIRFLCLNRDRDVPLHRPDHLEIVYLEEGEVGYQVGSPTCTLRQGDIIVVGDNISHRCLRTNNVHSEVHSTVLYFRPELVAPGSPRTAATARCHPLYTYKSPLLPVAEALPRVVCDSHRGVIYEFAMDRSTSGQA